MMAPMLFLVLGCKQLDSNWLDGSLSETYELDFDEVRARLYSSELSIEYVSDPDNAALVALRVTIDVTGGELQAGKAYDLAQRGNVSRSDAYGSPLPHLESGTLELDKYGTNDGADVVGSFDATFETTQDAQLQVTGAFRTTLEVVDL